MFALKNRNDTQLS